MSAEPLQLFPHLHIAVTRDRLRLPSRRPRCDHPMRGFVFGRNFPSSLARVPVNLTAVVRVILRVVCQCPTASGLLPLPGEPGSFDVTLAWWRPCERALHASSAVRQRSTVTQLPAPSSLVYEYAIVA